MDLLWPMDTFPMMQNPQEVDIFQWDLQKKIFRLSSLIIQFIQYCLRMSLYFHPVELQVLGPKNMPTFTSRSSMKNCQQCPIMIFRKLKLVEEEVFNLCSFQLRRMEI